MDAAGEAAQDALLEQAEAIKTETETQSALTSSSAEDTHAHKESFGTHTTPAGSLCGKPQFHERLNLVNEPSP